MASGVRVADEVVHAFHEMKIRRSGEDCSRRPKALFMKLSADNSKIEIDGSKGICVGDIKEDYDFFKMLNSKLDPLQPSYLLWDASFMTGECTKQELVLISWVPDTAGIKPKLMFSSSKEALVKAFPGVKHNWEYHSMEDALDIDSMCEKLGANRLEGRSVGRQKTTK